MDERVSSSETQPLLPRQDDVSKSSGRLGWLRNIFPRFDVIHPRYRWLPFLGCLIVFLNESEYFLRNFADYRAIEALHCIEYYNDVDPDIARLGKSIPEKLCKANIIQEQVSVTYATYLGLRMLFAMIGAIPLGTLADRKGRRLVTIMHKVNLTAAVCGQIAICELTLRCIMVN